MQPQQHAHALMAKLRKLQESLEYSKRTALSMGYVKRSRVLTNRLDGCTKYIAGLLLAAPEEDPVCPICLDELSNPSFHRWNGVSEHITQDDSNKLLVTECGHVFHGNCLEKWRRDHRGNCPSCRGEI